MRTTPLLALSAALTTLAAAPVAGAESLVRAPYLQMVTPTSALVVWTTDVPADSLVRYGTSPGALGQVAPSAAAVTQHEIPITGLSPATRYYYAVGSAGGTLAGGDVTHYFDTAPPTGSKKKLRAWIVGDSGTGNAAQRGARDAMLKHVGRDLPHLFLHVGDIAYDNGTTLEFTANFFAMYAGVLRHTAVWPTMGNHEGKSASSTTQTGPYYTAYVLPRAGEAGGLPSGTEAYYSYDHANVHFIVLNSQDIPSTPGSPMLTWLSADIAATSQPWIIAYWHHPPYSRGSHNSDTESQLITMRENVLPILEAGGVDLVLTGHSHIYERSYLVDGAYDTPTTAGGHIKDPGDGKPLGSGPYKKPLGEAAHAGAVHVVAGHGGANLGGTGGHPLMYFSELAHGTCVLDVQDNRLGLMNIRSDGVVSDRFAMIKGNGFVVAAPDGGEALAGGSAFDIRWTTVGSVPSVKIEYSIDDGGHWATIVASTPNTGSHAWSVPALDTNAALVRVSSAGGTPMMDESNASFTITATAPSPVIPLGSTWKYHDQGVDLGPGWISPGYDDSGWPSGPAQLGYGDGDEATTLNKATPVQPSYYFRRTVDLPGPVVAANLQVLHDDGVAVWINGNPVFAEHMGNGVSYGAFASTGSADNEVDSVPVSLAPTPFVVGPNVITAMVKQSTPSSTDVSFDLELSVVLGSAPVGTGGGGAGGTGGGGGMASSSSGGVGGGAASSSSGGVGGGMASSSSGGVGGAMASSSSGGVGGGSGSGGAEGGCGCEAAGASRLAWGWVTLGGLALLAGRWRRRRG